MAAKESLMARMKSASFVKNAATLSKSEMFKDNNLIELPIPILNLAYSGRLKSRKGKGVAGFGRGVHQIAGPSKHFKSKLALVLVKAFQEEHDDGIVIFYDSEFGSLPEYFETDGIDIDRVLHVPITNIEEFNFDINKKLEELSKTDKVMIFVDSIGNLASKKEVESALKENSAQDMTRAKSLKALFRIVTPQLTVKNIPMICINHTYDTQEMYSKKVVSGGTGIEYSSHSIFIMGKRQVKDGTELSGFEFVLNTNKSRVIKEKSALPITVTFEGGIDKYSGLYDIALLTGHIKKPTVQSHIRPFVIDPSTGEPETRLWKKKDLNTAEFWEPILADDSFNDAVEQMFSLSSSKTFVLDEKTGEASIADVAVEDDETVRVDTETGEILKSED